MRVKLAIPDRSFFRQEYQFYGGIEMSKRVNFKKTVSWMVGIPSALVMFSEVEDMRYWFVPFVAAGLLAVILYWNNVFDTEKSNG